jgi:hypothetical protein
VKKYGGRRVRRKEKKNRARQAEKIGVQPKRIRSDGSECKSHVRAAALLKVAANLAAAAAAHAVIKARSVLLRGDSQ